MHDRIVIIGDIKEQAAGSVFVKGHGQEWKFLKFLGHLIEYIVVKDERELEMNHVVTKNTVLCLDYSYAAEAMESQLEILAYKTAIFLPNIKKRSIEEILHMVLLYKEFQTNSKRKVTVLGGCADSMGEGLLQIIEQFGFLKESSRLQLIAGTGRELTVDEICQMEDAVTEYMQDDGLLKIKQKIYNKNKKEKDCYIIYQE